MARRPGKSDFLRGFEAGRLAERRRNAARLRDPREEQIGYIRHDAHLTEVEAAFAVPGRSTLRWHALACIAAAGVHGCTDDEITAAYTDDSAGLRADRPNMFASRRKELQDAGWVEQHPDRLCRETRSGNSAMVWVMTPEGRLRFQEEMGPYPEARASQCAPGATATGRPVAPRRPRLPVGGAPLRPSA